MSRSRRNRSVTRASAVRSTCADDTVSYSRHDGLSDERELFFAEHRSRIARPVLVRTAAPMTKQTTIRSSSETLGRQRLGEEDGDRLDQRRSRLNRFEEEQDRQLYGYDDQRTADDGAHDELAYDLHASGLL
jgi:hypothetical protein